MDEIERLQLKLRLSESERLRAEGQLETLQLKFLQLQKASSANSVGRASSKEYKILVEYDLSLEEELNKLAQQGWVVKGTLSETEGRYARIILERDVPQG